MFKLSKSRLACLITYNYYKGQREQKLVQQQAQANQEQANIAKYLEQGKLQNQLNQCLASAQSSYTQYLEANATDVKTDASGQKLYQLTNAEQQFVQNRLEQDKNDCYRQYGNN